jgi:archaemetzincin
MEITSQRNARDLGLLLVVFVMASLAGLGLIGNAGPSVGEAPMIVRQDIKDESPEFAALLRAAERIAPLSVPLGTPQPGEWLDKHPEAGQTFAEYRAGDPNRPDSRHTTMYLQPLGTFDDSQTDLLAATADLLGRFYGLPVKIRAAITLDGVPAYARRVHPTWGDAQVLAPYVLDLLQRQRPDDAVAVLGLTTADLWPGTGWNFVFGQASLQERVGVWSLYRQGDPKVEHTTCLRRTLKTAVHEMGHMLGIRHCTFAECCMNGSNHRAEADARPLWFCAQDEPKVWWACHVDPAARYRRLAEFAATHGLDAEARFWRDSLAAVESPTYGVLPVPASRSTSSSPGNPKQ